MSTPLPPWINVSTPSKLWRRVSSEPEDRHYWGGFARSRSRSLLPFSQDGRQELPRCVSRFESNPYRRTRYLVSRRTPFDTPLDVKAPLRWTSKHHSAGRQTGRNYRSVLSVVKPDTLIRWHRKGFRLFWKWKSRSMGRPRVPIDLQKLIVHMASNNPKRTPVFALQYYLGQEKTVVTQIPYPQTGPYPVTMSVPYPLVGTTNSAVRAGIISVTGGSVTWMKIEGDPRDHYIARLQWIDANSLLVSNSIVCRTPTNTY